MRWWDSVQRSRRHPQYFEYHGLAGHEHMAASCRADLLCILHHLLMSIALEARDPGSVTLMLWSKVKSPI